MIESHCKKEQKEKKFLKYLGVAIIICASIKYIYQVHVSSVRTVLQKHDKVF